MTTTVRRIAYFTVQMRDVPGEGVRLLKLMRKHEVNLLALSAFPRWRGSQVDLVPENKDRLLALEEQLEWELSEEKSTFLVTGANESGVLVPVLEKLARAKINVTSIQAVMSTKSRFGAVLWVRPSDYGRAARTLGAE